jgi:nucleoside-diphosphate-sugar epimerase
MTEHYRDRQVIVTGGLGFIGSNLVLRLVELGARVTVIDGCIPGCGANEFNLASVRQRVEVIRADLSQSDLYESALASASVIFNLAGEISHIQSMRDPERDLRLNTFSQLRLLSTLARVNPGARVVYAGTRQVCGRPRYLPVDEDHPIEPVDFNGIHKRAAENYHLLMSRDGLIDAVVLRLTNVYGPRLAIGVPGQGFLSVFIACALEGRPLEVFGDGRQLRDPVFVGDAVEAFLLAGVPERLPSRLYHLGGPEALSLLDIARIVSRVAGLPSEVQLRPFPEEIRTLDIGSYTTDSKRLQAALSWRPQVSFPEGIRRTLEYFRKYREHYLPAAAPDAVPAA